MKIKNKIRLYFSTTVIALTALSSIIISILFAEYREEEFQQRQKEKIKYTLGLLVEYQELSENLSAIMDKLTIHDFYDEKMLIYDQQKQLIYKSVDDLPIEETATILNELSPANQWIETKEDKYDVIGMYLESGGKTYYALSKAYDAFGYTKLNFLQNTLVVIFIVITGIVLFISNYLSRKISSPLTNLAEKVGSLNINDKSFKGLEVDTTSYELKYLGDKFNQLINRTNDAFAFQKHAAQHISHELKTPIAVLVSELERAKNIPDAAVKNEVIENQINKAKSLADVITVLLEISKNESGNQIALEPVRVDELIFNGIEELSITNPEFRFEISFQPDDFNESQLELNANTLLVKQAFLNVMRNCISYSLEPQAKIIFDGTIADQIKISFVNEGNPIKAEEEIYLFDHFYKGSNNPGHPGFGLGLVLTKKIVELHHGIITYSNSSGNKIQFDISFPLS